MNRQLLFALGLALASLADAAGPAVATLYSGRPLRDWLADLDDEDLLIREEAIEVLAQAGPAAKSAVGRLTKLLAHESRPLRTRAALAVWRISGDARPAVTA